MSIKIEEVSTDTTFLALQADWNHLLAQSRNPNVFLTWDWFFCWWKYFGGGKQLHILIAKDEAGTIRGIAPLFITVEKWGLRNLRVVKFLGTHPISSEYLDFICEERYAREGAEAFLNYLTASKEVDLLFFSDLREDSLVLKSANQVDSRTFQIEAGETCPFISFPSDWEEYQSALSARTRKYLKQIFKYFLEEKGGGLKKALARDYERVLARLFELHTQRWQAKGKPGGFVTAEKLNFHGEIAQRLSANNQLGLYYLEVDQKIISVLYGFSCSDTYYFYQSGFDLRYKQYSPGQVVLFHAIQDCFNSGIKRFDFLRGDEEYKRKWTNSENKTYNLLIPLIPKAKLALQTRRGYLELKRVVKGLLRKPF